MTGKFSFMTAAMACHEIQTRHPDWAVSVLGDGSNKGSKTYTVHIIIRGTDGKVHEGDLESMNPYYAHFIPAYGGRI